MRDAWLAGIAALDAANAEEFFAAPLEIGLDGFDVVWWHDKNHPHSHVEGFEQFVCLDFSQPGEKIENMRHGPGSQIDLRFHPGWQNTRQVARNPSAGDVRKRGNPATRNNISQRRRVAQMGLQEFRANLVADFGDVGFGLQVGNFEDQFACQRIAVGVQPCGWKRQQRVAGLHGFSGENLLALDYPNDETRKIIFSRRIKPGHLGGFATDQRAAGFASRAAHALDKLLNNRGIELPHGDIIEEKKRRRALNKNVVNAMVHQIAAHG